MNRIKYFDTMKGITIILVVFAHVTRMFTPQGVIKLSYSPLLENITNFIYMFHMPAFVAVTGGVYYFAKREKRRYSDNKKFIVNKMKRIIIPFIFISMMVVFPTLNYIGLKESFWDFFIFDVLGGMSSTHLWYSIMIFMVFVIFNFADEILYKNKGWINWGVFILLNLSSFLFPNVWQLRNILRYAVYFFLGCWFQKNRKKLQPWLSRRAVLILFFTVFCYVLLSYTPIAIVTPAKIIIQLIGAVSGISMLYLISEKLSRTNIIANDFFNEIIKSSYGIFLFHPMIIYLLSYWEQGVSINSFVLVAVNFSVSLLFSIILVFILRKLNLQVLIGE